MTVNSAKAASLIRLALEGGPLIQTRGIVSATVLWDTLKALYEPQGFSQEFLIYKKLFSTTLANSKNSIEVYLARIRRLTDDLKVKKLAIPEKVIAAYTLNNLTPDYEHIVAIISQTF